MMVPDQTVQELSRWQTNKQTLRRDWKHCLRCNIAPRVVITLVVTTT